jgi:16S rRNA (cytosine967-C5)-methyltransferase
MGVRSLAARTLCQVIGGQSLSRALPPALGKTEEPALAQELVYGTLRWHFRISGLINQMLEKPLKQKDQDIECLIRIGLYQLMCMNIPAHAAVNETVRETRTMKKPWAKGLVNGILRRYQRESATLEAALTEAQEQACPEWLINGLKQAYPDHWSAICVASNERPPMTLRVNTMHRQRPDYASMLVEQGITSSNSAQAPAGLTLEQPCDVTQLPGFDKGWVSVQDAAAQLAGEYLDCQPGMRVLDACAAPGGKTAHLLERASNDLDLWAIEKAPERIASLQQTLDRQQLTARIIEADAADTGKWWDQTPFDRILLDAPCSATGVIRRHPDIRLHRTRDDIETLVKEQQKLLETLWPLVRPGGMLLYATCSVLPQENVEQVKRFLDAHSDAREHVLPGDFGHRPGHGLQILPGVQGMDGFYYAGIEKLQA